MAMTAIRISGQVPFPESMAESAVIEERFGLQSFTSGGKDIADDDQRLAVNTRFAHLVGQVGQCALNDLFVIP
jgi:hypothetical protein